MHAVAACILLSTVPNVLVTDGLSPAAIRLLSNRACVTQRALSRSELDGGALSQFDAVIIRSATALTARALECGAAGHLRVVGRAGVGIDNIDVGAARASGALWVLNTPSASTGSVVELTLAHLLAAARAVPAADRALREGRWLKPPSRNAHEVRGKRLGLVGFGRIARGVAAAARALGMEVATYSPSADANAAARLGVSLAPSAEVADSVCPALFARTRARLCRRRSSQRARTSRSTAPSQKGRVDWSTSRCSTGCPASAPTARRAARTLST